MLNMIKFGALAVILFAAILLAVVTGDEGPWYFGWLVGTMMIVLISVSGAVLFESQEAAMRVRPQPNDKV
jgi:predicted outer membrane lipoprotein